MASEHLYTLTVISKIKMAGITTTNEHASEKTPPCPRAIANS